MTLAIARARQPDGRRKTELARAIPCFGQLRRPLFNDVAVEAVGPVRNGKAEKTVWFARLRMLFTCVDHREKQRAYAFVRWYQRTGPSVQEDATKMPRSASG